MFAHARRMLLQLVQRAEHHLMHHLAFVHRHEAHHFTALELDLRGLQTFSDLQSALAAILARG